MPQPFGGGPFAEFAAAGWEKQFSSAGARAMTSREASARFFAATTAAASGELFLPAHLPSGSVTSKRLSKS